MLLAALIGAFLWFIWSAPKPVPQPVAPVTDNDDVRVELTQSAEDFAGSNHSKYPLFDPAGSKWLVDDKAQAELADYMIDDDPTHEGPDGIGKYIAVRLPVGAGPQIASQALRLLSAQGICQVAMAEGAVPDDLNHLVSIYRIKDIRAPDGTRQPCVDRYN